MTLALNNLKRLICHKEAKLNLRYLLIVPILNNYNNLDKGKEHLYYPAMGSIVSLSFFYKDDFGIK